MLSVHLVGRVARLVSILAVYDCSRVFRRPFTRKGPHFLSLGLACCGVCSARIPGEICTERSCFMYEKVMGWFWWSVVDIVALRFGCTCVLHLSSVWSKKASVLAHQGVQEGSGACIIFSNDYYGQVLCMWTGGWTGVAALGAGLHHNDHTPEPGLA